MNKETMEKLQDAADYIQDQIDKDEEFLYGTDWLEVNGRQKAVDALTESQDALKDIESVIDAINDEDQQLIRAEDIDAIAFEMREKFCTLEDDMIGDERDTWESSVASYLQGALKPWMSKL